MAENRNFGTSFSGSLRRGILNIVTVRALILDQTGIMAQCFKKRNDLYI